MATAVATMVSAVVGAPTGAAADDSHHELPPMETWEVHEPSTAELEQIAVAQTRARSTRPDRAPESPESRARLARARARMAAGTGARGGEGVPTGGGIKTQDGLLITHISQLAGTWCGAATVEMALRHYNLYFGANWKEMQNTIAKALEIPQRGGTDWYRGGSTPRPVPSLLTYHTRGKASGGGNLLWSAQDVTGGERVIAGELSDFKAAVVTNISDRNPVLGNTDTWEQSPYRLVGHPKRRILHWYLIYGYWQTGAGMSYLDPASGGVGVSFAATVPPRSSLEAYKLNFINAGRGYVW